MSNSRRYGYTGTEPMRCVCQLGADAHMQHGKPKNQVGKHLDPRCPHSELYNALVRFPMLHDRKRAKRFSKQPMARTVGS